MCDQRHNITMCPLCDKTCSYWKMSSACATARASHLFDNPATVFFSVFMALWGKQRAAARLWGAGALWTGPSISFLLLEIIERGRESRGRLRPVLGCVPEADWFSRPSHQPLVQS